MKNCEGKKICSLGKRRPPKVSLHQVSDGLRKVSDGLGKVSDGLGKVSDGCGTLRPGTMPWRGTRA